jgi:sugar O-acyltransferase (sialic acid O-acetyltransferase NeuD family)|tara:strand:- start:57 stop:659 length:603 start_codon:yes stop_codon:yes gene_type:complete
MLKLSKKIAVIGTGGFAKEILYSFHRASYDLFSNKEFIKDNNVKAIEDLDFNKYKILLAIGDPKIRKKIVSSFPDDADYLTYIDKHAIILDHETIKIGKGSVICAGSILTSNINLGNFSQINLNSTIGHDCNIDEYFTTAPGVHISGKSNIGTCNYFGTNSSSINNINICSNVTIGMNSNVIKNITEEGTYVGNPLKKIK